nr:MAG TPA: hypothetical protein [Bacteriophage sp.]DAO07722.1 MAG TPA: hypothetical protein [Caudoviricetes sp.]
MHKYRKAKSRGFYSPALFMVKPAFTITFLPRAIWQAVPTN